MDREELKKQISEEAFIALSNEAQQWFAWAILDDAVNEHIGELFHSFSNQYIDRIVDLDVNPRSAILIMLPKLIDILYNTIAAGLGEKEAEALIDFTYNVSKVKAKHHFERDGEVFTKAAKGTKAGG